MGVMTDDETVVAGRRELERQQTRVVGRANGRADGKGLAEARLFGELLGGLASPDQPAVLDGLDSLQAGPVHLSSHPLHLFMSTIRQ
jgi:hypothetical protein